MIRRCINNISSYKEAIVGACVVIGILMFVLTYTKINQLPVSGYDLIARFEKSDGIIIGSDVRLCGISIGKVVARSLDQSFRAVINMHITANVSVPTDSVASIHTDGLFGAKFIELQPGVAKINLKPREKFHHTQDSINLQNLLELIITQIKVKH
ncbi:MAG: MlaD family protein [Rhodospirillaceae bacterium]|jgi:phospholipid/cholesterol/gamma-HCH transport system substrate-binding protein|nr:MlaD family protein [Rhodospirillaceae bacterium]